MGDKEGVLAALEDMRDLDPRNGDYLLETAWVHEELGNEEQALQALADYVNAFPEDATGYARLAALQKRLGNYLSARGNLEEASLWEPLSASFQAQLAALELDAGNFADAWASYERALELTGTPEQMDEVRLGIMKYHLRRGELALAGEVPIGMPAEFFFVGFIPANLELSSPERMRGEYSALEARGFSEPILQVVSGLVAELEEDHASAIERYRQAMALDGALNLHRNLGRALRLAGRLDESEAELREALHLVPGDPKAHLEMALLLEAQGDLDGAVEHLRGALAAWENADEDYEPARQARAKLEELRDR